MKIDIFPHILPKKYFAQVRKKAKKGVDFSRVGSWVLTVRSLSEIDIRLRLMDRYPDVVQVLNVSAPPLETLVNPGDAVELAQIANDELAELVIKYPDKFLAAVACLPMDDIDAAIEEADRAITQLRFRGIQIFTNINGEPLDAPKLKPLYERMAHYNLPILIHPWGQPTSTARVDLSTSPIAGLGWPFETTVAMGCLVKAGVFQDYPDIKFITHHCGGMVPFFERRIGMGQRITKFAQQGKKGAQRDRGIRKDDFHKFYADTALYGNTAALMCGYAYFGVDHLLFGTDMPLGAGMEGYGYTLETVRAIERMEIPDGDKNKIFEDNARNVLRLAI